jgi:hypothetical protein
MRECRLCRREPEESDADRSKRGRQQLGAARRGRQAQGAAHRIGARVRNEPGSEREQREQSCERTEWREQRHQ